MLRIFADNHHSGLSYSLRLLAKRLGAEIYFPIGESWFTEGYWQIAKPYGNNESTVKQYLTLNQDYRPVDGTFPLNTIKEIKPTYYEVKDLFHGDVMKSITLDQFKEMDIDVVIASIPDHWISFAQLIKDHKPKAKLVCQIGNIDWDEEQLIKEGQVKNLLASVKEFRLPKNINVAFYHQEIPLRDYKEPPTNSKIKSFVHLLPKRDTYNEYKEELAEVEFKAFGALAPDGYCNGIDKVYDEMQDSSFVYNWKPRADGFGHIVFSSMMLGRVLLINYEEYKDKLIGKLLIPDETCISLDSGESFTVICDKIRHILKNREELLKMSKSAFNIFHKFVNYKKESIEIKKFFERLL